MPVSIAYARTTPRDLQRAAVIDIFSRPGAFNNRIGWKSDTTGDLQAKFRNSGTVAGKVTYAPLTRTGIDYANLKHNADRETGPLPHGQEWAVDSDGNSLFPYIIVSADGTKDYVRIYADIRTIHPVYFIDGVEVAAAEYKALLIPSKAKPRPLKLDDNGDPIYTLTISPLLANIVI